MKTISIKYIIITAALLVTSFGCNDQLDLKPLDSVSDANFWKSANDFKLAANQFYTFERSFIDVVNGTNPENTPHHDNRADFAGDGNLWSRGQNTIPATDNVWNSNYSGSRPTGAWSRIRVINYLLDKASTYAKPDEIAVYVAEAKFFRAYVYFELLQLYGGVPIVDKLYAIDSPELYGPRNTRDETADFIIADLNNAIPALPEIPNTDANYGRVSKSAALSFLGRVALFEGTWQKTMDAPNITRANALLDIAATASDAVITAGLYSLFQPAALGDSAQKYMFILENQKSNPAGITKSANKEYILANRYDQTIRQIRLDVSRIGGGAGNKSYADLFLCQDGLPTDKSPLFKGYAKMNSEFQNRDNRMRYTMKIPGKYYWKGYVNLARINWLGDASERAQADASPFLPNSGSGYGGQKWIAERSVPQSQEGYDYPVIRYAEVLLNYAEAIFERNGTISDADLNKSLNLVRQRVNKNMPKLSNAFVSANGLDMRNEIRRERSIELNAEGFRIDDLKRWHVAVAVLSQPLLGIQWTGTEYVTKWPSASSLPKNANGNIIVDASRSFSDKNYLLPIPSQQIILNPSLEQNPGW